MRIKAILFIGAIMATTVLAGETLAPLKGGKAPQTFDELWAGFNPRKEPLDVETLKTWEEDGVVLSVLRYRVGIFKGQKAMVAAVYGYPKGGKKLPGLVQIHGGGQYADYRACLYNGKRGYATISVSWAGRINAPGYVVNPDVVKLFWAGKTDDPRYKLTTDWGPLDGYHAPCRNPKNGFHSTAPAAWTLDAVDSPRNNPWFLAVLAARRALTFLERQPQVDADRLGVYGHSMGGKLTVMTAGADSRVKAAAPSCGGLSNRDTGNALYDRTIADDVYLKHITCPIFFLSPANDFHGRINDLQTALGEIRSKDWRMTCAAHHNHQDTEPSQVAGPLWFDQYLKHEFNCPSMPEISLDLTSGIPSVTVTPDTSRKIVDLDVFYTQQGKPEPGQDARLNAIHHHWHYAAPTKKSTATWTATLPLLTTDKPLWVYANVLYALDKPVTGAGYYYGPYTATTFNLSSRMAIATLAQLRKAGVRATVKPSLVIEDFGKDWEKEWFTYDLSDNWARKTHKIYNRKWQAPPFAKLAVEVCCAKPNKLVVGLDEFGAEVKLKGGGQWQSVVLYPVDFHSADGASILDWNGRMELRLGPIERLRSKDRKSVSVLGGAWAGPKPEFRNMRWVNGTREELNARRTVKLAKAKLVGGKTYLDIKYADAFTYFYKVVMNKYLNGKPFMIDGKVCAHGIATHAPANGVFFVGGKFRRLHAIAAPSRSASVVYQVFADDRKVFDSGLLKGGATKTIDLPLAGVQEIRLVITDGGNGKGGDAASWIDAYVE